MSVLATISTPFTSIVEGAATGLAGIIGVQIRDTHGTVIRARSTDNIIELTPGSGVYQWSCPQAPGVPGTYTILWDDGSGHFAAIDLQAVTSWPPTYVASPTTGIRPDLTGFVNSRNVLYQNFGIYVAFLIPIEPSYAPGVPLNPFGEPLDPWAMPASGAIEGTAYTSAFASGLLVTRPYGGRGQVRDQQGETPLGIMAEQLLGMNILPIDYARFGPGGSLGTATHAEFWGERFQIREWRPDGVGGLQRFVVYLSQESQNG